MWFWDPPAGYARALNSATRDPATGSKVVPGGTKTNEDEQGRTIPLGNISTGGDLAWRTRGFQQGEQFDTDAIGG
jgi:hypothetical protein